MINKPHIITIKAFLVGEPPTAETIDALLCNHSMSLLSMEATPMEFDGNGLVPVKASAELTKAKVVEPKAKPVEAKAKAPQPPKGKKVGIEIRFEQGSDAEKVWLLLRDGPALTSTQIRETLGLGSNIVNTTVYRLKGAGMIRPMSYNAPNGDTLYTGTNSDTKAVKPAPVDLNAALSEFAEGLDDEGPI